MQILYPISALVVVMAHFAASSPVAQRLATRISPGTVNYEADSEFDDLQMPMANLTTSQIWCLPEEFFNPPTTVEDCRPVLNSFRNYTDFSKVQEFVKAANDRYSKPKVPKKPPYIFEEPGVVNCAVSITSHVDDLSAWFSFRQARQVMQNIIEHCQNSGGRGGGASIGMDRTRKYDVNAWIITAVGRSMTPADMDYLHGQAMKPTVSEVD